MYYEYFNLKEHPFRLTCEPRYFYLSPEHSHAKALMEYALIKRHGIMALTGEVGTGKTMLVEHFLSRLDKVYRIIKINQTQLSLSEILQLLLQRFDETTEETNVRALMQKLLEHMQQLHEDGLHTVIIVDEAQNLDTTALSHLYQLSQQRAEKIRICTIYLVGQNELREKLESPELKELITNVNSRYHLAELSLKEIKNYIFHRLAVAGGHKSVNFDDDVFPIIETYTGGRPRLINVLTDHILTYAYLENIKDINTKVVDGAIEDLQWLPHGVQYGKELPTTNESFKEERRQSYKILIRSADKIRGELYLRKKRINIGRHRDNDLRIDDALLSRHHAQIIQQGRAIYLRDLNSTNGTYINEKRIDIAILSEGTEIRVGKCYLKLVRHHPEQQTEKFTVDEQAPDFSVTSQLGGQG